MVYLFTVKTLTIIAIFPKYTLLFKFNNFSSLQVVKAAQGRVPVFLDGGVRRGTDVFKALALGASGIFVSIYTFEI